MTTSRLDRARCTVVFTGQKEAPVAEHEEVLLVPRWVKCKRVTFKYGLGDDFINVLKTIKMLGLDNRFPVDLKRVKVAPRDVAADNETCMKRYGVQAVVWQTAVNPVIAWELLQTGAWKGEGVLGPEAFEPEPFMALMPAYDFPFGLKEMTV